MPRNVTYDGLGTRRMLVCRTGLVMEPTEREVLDDMIADAGYCLKCGEPAAVYCAGCVREVRGDAP